MLDKILNLLLIIALAFLAFLGGALVVMTKSFPYALLDQAYDYTYERVTGAYQRRFQDKELEGFTEIWRPARTDRRGVTVYKPSEAYHGLTLVSVDLLNTTKLRLLSMDGKVAHEWVFARRGIWEDARPGDFFFLDYAHLYPNGDLLLQYAGKALVKIDRNSNIIWTYLAYVHHHLDVTDDGTVYTLYHEGRHKRFKRYAQIELPRLDDYVVVLSPDGEQINKVSIVDALARSPYGRMLRSTSWNSQHDFLHTNSIEFIDRAAAAQLPFAKEGQVLLSMREIDTIAVMDLEKEEIVWATQGSWQRQHDADILPNGHILLFDNRGHYGPGGGSRVIEVDPVTQEIVWSYAGDANHRFESAVRSGQQRLPNGNTLITESDGGRLLEVTRGGEIVWEYITPVRVGNRGQRTVSLWLGSARIARESLDPEFLGFINQPKPPTQASAGEQ
ncbi:MAG: aryl-sulfate sulfotransferase [Gammaproteobacteria bacterium]|nr:aryl-sulfate sulfotransferase [Gammaproteobacteria bacterium]